MFPSFPTGQAWKALHGFASGIGLWFLVPLPVAAQYATVTKLYSFANSPDGRQPSAGLILGTDGNFYGTTTSGGAHGGGTIFRITPTGQETVFYSFKGGTDGAYPATNLVQGTDGNFYGTTLQGGAHGNGTVFKITPTGTESVLYTFGSSGSQDGVNPRYGVIQGADGNFYGTTEYGGANKAGMVFKITRQGTESVLYTFMGIPDGITPSPDGAVPSSGLLQGQDGSFYGVTVWGGTAADGTVYKIAPNGTETVLHSFTDVPDGKSPTDRLIAGPDGNLCGTTLWGGANTWGTLYRITPDGTEMVLYSFTGADGGNPHGGLIQGADGSFYGTTEGPGYGTVYKITADGKHILFTMFTQQGATPYDGLLQGPDGNFYGTTFGGGANGNGMVFRVALPRSDFNGDGFPDLLFQNNTSGWLAVWFMNGTTPVDGALLTPTQNPTWKAVGDADFNGDGKPDILFQNASTGRLAIWFMNGTTATGGLLLNATPPAGWNVVGISDFNGDGYPDILFQNQSSGQLAIWYLQGATVTGGAYVTSLPATGWQAVGTGDFNQDGHPDILFQNQSTGELAVWFMNNNTPINGAFITPGQQAGWRCVSVVDLNGDGWPDLIFQNTSTGRLVYWLLNGVKAVDGNAFTAQPASGWLAVGPR